MRFGAMRHRIVILSPMDTTVNSIGEEVPSYFAYHPGAQPTYVYKDTDDHGFPVWRVVGDPSPSSRICESEIGYWAEVKPTTGREYQEAQKLRAETTYNVYMRFVPGIRHDMKILYNQQLLNIESVLDYEERHKILNVVCSEVVR